MTQSAGPPDWNVQQIITRFVTAAPRSFNAEARTVDCVVSTGAPVARVYGTEILTISREAINTDRVTSGMCPLLDSHKTNNIADALGRVTMAWVERGALMATLAFNQTPEGDAALGMIARGEIAGISAGYRVLSWLVDDQDGRIVDQETTAWDDSLIFTGVKWELLEVSIVSVPADSSAGVRNFDDLAYGDPELANVRARMRARQNMTDRMSWLAKNLQS
jgi:HK97 family phage prohead protease